MNQIEKLLKAELIIAIQKAFGIELTMNDIVIESSKDKSHGDYATNIAMQLTRQLKQNPQHIATAIIDTFSKEDANVETLAIAGPGFINMTLKTDSLANIIEEVLEKQDVFGHNMSGAGKSIDLEYVSANPTGNLHLGHARGAAWGDSVNRILKASGYQVISEYYINDAGNQVYNLAKSLIARYHQLFGEEYEMPEDGYYGEDVIDIAKKLKEKYGNTYLHVDNQEVLDRFKRDGMDLELEKIKQDLQVFRVKFDIWASEQALHDEGRINEVLSQLDQRGMLYEKDGALWFKSSQFGDDKDRVLRKSDGSYTYLVPDIAYHLEKFSRGCQTLVDFLGGDHHGYIARMKAAMQAFGKNPNDIEVDIIQMVRLIEDGQEVKMSKRTGNAITLKELCEEVGIDATRYFFVQRALDTHLDFDMNLAKKQSNENPVYYAQYAHARICSILKQSTLEEAESYELLTHEKEIALLKQLHEFTTIVSEAAKIRGPHKICQYIQKLAQQFHSFYGSCKVNDTANIELSKQRLALLKAVKITLKNALALIGVESPNNM